MEEMPRARLWPVFAWAAALVSVWWVGALLERHGFDLVMFKTQPFLGGPVIIVGPGIVLALAVAIAAVVYLPLAVSRLSWWPMLAVCWTIAVAWTVSLSSIRGVRDLARPLLRDDDYGVQVPLADRDLHGFVDTFTREILNYAVHVQGHPPGQVVLLTWLSRVGISSPTEIAWLYVLVGCTALVSVGIAVKALGHEDVFRRAAPFLVLAPGAVWIATSPDAFFSGVLAFGVALLALATKRLWLAVPAGLVLGMCPFLSYGLLSMGVVLLVPLLVTRAWRVAAVAAGAALVVLLAWTMAGFRIDEGIVATREAWHLNGASVRPYWYFLVANFVVLATLVGPGALAGLPGVRALPKAVRWFVWLALFGALVGSLSGYMRGEVERIWQPLVPWVCLAAAVTGPRRAWLAAGVLVALACQIIINSPW